MAKNTFDLDHDPMILILKLDLDMVKMYLYNEDEVPSYSSSKVIAWTDTQTDTQTDKQTWVKLLPIHMRIVKTWVSNTLYKMEEHKHVWK